MELLWSCLLYTSSQLPPADATLQQKHSKRTPSLVSTAKWKISDYCNKSPVRNTATDKNATVAIADQAMKMNNVIQKSPKKESKDNSKKKATSQRVFVKYSFEKSNEEILPRKLATTAPEETKPTKRKFSKKGILKMFSSSRKDPINAVSYTHLFENGEISVLDPSLPPMANSKFANDFWKNVRVGDIVRIHNNDEIPADVILLSTSDIDGGCYVETKNLDGESNLKVRQSLRCTNAIRNSRDICRTKFWVESEGPHANLYVYQGNLKWIDSLDGQTHNEPITINNMLLRGCTLRNTKWAMGIVVFTGDDTKTMINAGVTPVSYTHLDVYKRQGTCLE